VSQASETEGSVYLEKSGSSVERKINAGENSEANPRGALMPFVGARERALVFS